MFTQSNTQVSIFPITFAKELSILFNNDIAIVKDLDEAIVGQAFDLAVRGVATQPLDLRWDFETTSNDYRNIHAAVKVGFCPL